MATVYKVELDIVSDWIAFSNETVKDLIKKEIEKSTLRVTEIKVKEQRLNK